MTTFEIKGNKEYAAEVVEVKNLITLEGLDNLVGLAHNGYTALVSKSTRVGDVLVVFPAEAQLSHEFVSANNLYSDASLNADSDAKGYLGKNRRVRAIRLRGHVSSALALSPDSLAKWANSTRYGVPAVGTRFDHIDGHEVSRKYEVPVKANLSSVAKSAQEKIWRRVDSTFLPEHIDSENYWRNSHKIAPETIVTVSQKLHGTSIRIGNTIVKRKPTWKDKVAKFFGVPVAETEFDVVFGSRKVIKDPNNPLQNHFYGHDIWTDEGRKYADLIPQNVVVYGELIGWTKDGAPIQTGYTYNVPKGEAHLYVYRVAVISNDGRLYDLSWEAMTEFCQARGLNVVPLLWRGPHRFFEVTVDSWMDLRYAEDVDDALERPLPLSDAKTVDEGVVVRAEGIVPVALKAKSPRFFEWESAILDQGVEVLS